MLSWILYMSAMGTLAIVFALSVNHKLRDYARFRASLGAYQLVPEGLLDLFAPLVILLELAAIVAILIPTGPGVSIAFGLLILYTVALTVNLLRGNTSIDCGCGDAPTPISGWLLVRNGALLMLALPHEPEGGPPDLLHWALVVTLVTLLVVFYLILEQLLANHARLTEG
ncbi:MAG: hypothetical protein EP301_13390 [Gammaproteobacteria bacterium]|nr:MAG: hypothetical protein EP301_13390 [Gammaproteobacteria bacterium]